MIPGIRRWTVTTSLAFLGLLLVGEAPARADEPATIRIRNTSPYVIQVGVRVGNGYYWRTISPGDSKGYYPDVFVFSPFVQGQQRIPVAIYYNGVTRTGSLPLYSYNGVIYAGGDVFKRSPGILGLQSTAGSP